MTANQYRAAIKTLGLSQYRAADWLGIGRRTSQGYALGESPIPPTTAKLLSFTVWLKKNDPELLAKLVAMRNL